MNRRMTHDEEQAVMDKIAWTAVQYILDRRMKIEARFARNALIARCEVLSDAHGHKSPCFTDRTPEGNYLPDVECCEHCLKARRKHDEYMIQSRSAGSRLRSLERLVNKAKAGRV